MHHELTELHQIRLQEGLSFRALAERVGISAGALHKLIRGKTQPSEITSYRVRQYLNSRQEPRRKGRP